MFKIIDPVLECVFDLDLSCKFFEITEQKSGFRCRIFFFFRLVIIYSSYAVIGLYLLSHFIQYIRTMHENAGFKRATDEGSLPEIAQYSPYTFSL